jgi:sugar lactone lactonase YvrE
LRSSRLCLGYFFLIACAGCSTQQAQSPPPKSAPPALEFLGEWGKRGNNPGELSFPSSIAVDGVGNVYLTDPGSGFVHKFSPLGEPLFSFQEPGIPCPDGIAVDQGGGIYVGDPVKGKVAIFFPNGDRLRVIHIAASGKCAEPLGISVNGDGDFFVVGSGRHAMQKFSPRGRLLQSWGGAKRPLGPAADPADVFADADGFLYVIDTNAKRVQKCAADGSPAASFSVPDSEPVPVRLAGLAVSSKLVFAADPQQHRVYVWSKDGQFLHSENLSARLRNQQPSPTDLAITPRGELLALDSGSARVLRFRINL